MNFTLDAILTLAGVIFLGLATFNVPGDKINLLAAGLFCLALTLLT